MLITLQNTPYDQLMYGSLTVLCIALQHSQAPGLVLCGAHKHLVWYKETYPDHPVFAYCKRSKTGWWEGLGTRLSRLLAQLVATCGTVTTSWNDGKLGGRGLGARRVKKTYLDN